MNTNQEIIIQFSRKKICSRIWLGVFLILLFGFFVYTSIVDPTESSYLIQVTSAPLMLGLLFIQFSNIKKLLNISPGLVINSKGIFDNSTFHSVGLIPWGDISKISIKTIHFRFQSNKYVIVEVHNPKKYVSQGNIFARFQRLSNNIFFNSPLFIISDYLNIDFEEMVDLVERNFRKYKSA